MGIVAMLSDWFRRLFPLGPLGRRGEAAAARHLTRRGYKILARSQRYAAGELDLVALDGETVVFVEVKTRRSLEAGHPSEAVDRAKQRQVTRAAQIFLKRHRLLDRPARFDVVSITWPEGQRPLIEHIRGAFEAVD